MVEVEEVSVIEEKLWEVYGSIIELQDEFRGKDQIVEQRIKDILEKTWDALKQTNYEYQSKY